MSYARVTGVNVHRDAIVVPVMDAVDPDPKWEYTDLAGHVHRWVDRAVPTVKRVVDYTYWCSLCSDEHESTHEECRECGEWIVPAVVHRGPHTVTVPGMLDVTVDVLIEYAAGITESKRLVPRTLEEAEAIEQLMRHGHREAIVDYLSEIGLLS